MGNTRLDVEANETAGRIQSLKLAIDTETDEKKRSTLATDLEREQSKFREQMAAAQASRNLKQIWNLKKRSGNKKMTYEDFAKVHGVQKTLISNYINGHQPMNQKWVFAFAKYLEVEPSEINPHLTESMGIGSVLDTKIIKLLENENCSYKFKEAMLTLLTLHISENAASNKAGGQTK